MLGHSPATGKVYGTEAVLISYRENDPVTGTLLNPLVTGTPNASPPKAIRTSTTSKNVAGICVDNCGTTGVATIAKLGECYCEFDGATTARNFVEMSTTDAGKCHDTGLSSNSIDFPTRGRIVGVSLQTTGAAGPALITLFPIGSRGHLEGLTANATLDFASLGGGNCEDLTVAVPGAAVGDPVALSHPTAGTRGLFDAWVSAADVVTIRHCSINGVNDPISATFRVAVLKF